MKKIILSAIVLTAMVSCRKDRTCECKTETSSVASKTDTNLPGVTITTNYTNSSTGTSTLKGKKKFIKASTSCYSTSRDLANTEVNGSSTTVTTGTSKTTCTLK
jgi:hypothetical protein